MNKYIYSVCSTQMVTLSISAGSPKFGVENFMECWVDARTHFRSNFEILTLSVCAFAITLKFF